MYTDLGRLFYIKYVVEAIFCPTEALLRMNLIQIYSENNFTNTEQTLNMENNRLV